MPKFIGLQSGHYQIENNVDPVLRTETGAPGEKDFNWAVTLALAPILISKGFQVQIDSANTNSDPNTLDKDFDFYLAIHAQASLVGGAISAPDPSVDKVNAESVRIVNAIKGEYFKDTGIIENDKIVNPNMTEYYMWSVLSDKTPCGIIECGDLADPHDSVILADHQRVALGIAHGICDAFGVPWGEPPPDYKALYLQEQTKLNNLSVEFAKYKTDNEVIVNTLKTKIENAIKDLS